MLCANASGDVTEFLHRRAGTCVRRHFPSPMSNDTPSPIEWILDMTVKPGKIDDLHALMMEMVEVTHRDEPGALCYEFWLSEDDTTCQVHECYADEAALKVHLATFQARFATRFFAALDERNAVVFGVPSQEVQQLIAGMHPLYLSLAAGFTR
jgi:quinol monooxygenase YgiN